jgi:hypothetical protein
VFVSGDEYVIPAPGEELVTLNDFVPVPKVAVTVSYAATPAEVVRVNVVADNETGGLIVSFKGTRKVAEAVSVTVKVSNAVLATELDVAVAAPEIETVALFELPATDAGA